MNRAIFVSLFVALEAIGERTLALFDALFPRQPLALPVYVPPAPLPPIPEPPDGFWIGDEAGSGKPIYALSPQLDRHLLIIGGTGCGKTTLIARLYTEEILKWR